MASIPRPRFFSKHLYQEGIPLTAFLVDGVESEVARLISLVVSFQSEPHRAGNEVMAILDDTCGNLIMIYQVAEV